MKKAHLLLALVAGLYLLASCASAKQISAYNSPNANWASLKTFDFVAFKSDSLRKIAKTFDVERIREAIEREMLMRGFSKNENNALLINLGVMVNPAKLDKPQSTPVYLGADHYNADAAPAIPFKEGVLIMQLIDTKSNTLVWQSAVTELMEDLAKGKVKTVDQIVDAVNKLFTHFPAEQKK